MSLQQNGTKYALTGWNKVLKAAVAVLCLCVAEAQNGMAFRYPLEPEQIREAYFIGYQGNTNKRESFLAPYIRHLPSPQKGPYVESIEFRTPYEQVVLRSWEHSNGYTAQQAEHDYAVKPNRIVLRILIYSTPTFRNLAVSTDDKEIAIHAVELVPGFQFLVRQDHHLIETKKMIVKPICQSPEPCDIYSGDQAFLYFDAEQFSSGVANVEVTTPDGQIIHTEFDLDQLK